MENKIKGARRVRLQEFIITIAGKARGFNTGSEVKPGHFSFVPERDGSPAAAAISVFMIASVSLKLALFALKEFSKKGCISCPESAFEKLRQCNLKMLPLLPESGERNIVSRPIVGGRLVAKFAAGYCPSQQ
jgi:hypothetical protein